MIIVDTGGLISEVDRGSRLHEATRSLLDGARAAGERLVISPFVLAEVDYLVSVRLGRPDHALQILEDVARGAYRLEPFQARDIEQAITVMRQYADLDIGLADASNVVLAERLDTADILTTDQKHFRAMRGPSGRPFRLLPADQ